MKIFLAIVLWSGIGLWGAYEYFVPKGDITAGNLVIIVPIAIISGPLDLFPLALDKFESWVGSDKVVIRKRGSK